MKNYEQGGSFFLFYSGVTCLPYHCINNIVFCARDEFRSYKKTGAISEFSFVRERIIVKLNPKVPPIRLKPPFINMSL